MASNLNYTSNFYKSLNALTGIPIKKLQEYARDNNPFNILEHPMVIEPNEKQMEKLNKLNEFIANYSLLRMEEEQKRIHFTTPKEAGRYFESLMGGIPTNANNYEMQSKLMQWIQPQGEYLVCSFEAENFYFLVTDALYKAQQYIFSTWLPNCKLQTEAFCVEYYETHTPETTKMEIWMKLKEA
jgi:predicted transcriptional regulator YdeE